MKEKTTKMHRAIIVLIGLILIRGFAGGGVNMTSGLFLAPVSQALGVGIGTLSIYMSISSITMIIWLPFAGKIINKYDIRLISLAAAVCMIGSFFTLGFCENVIWWYVLAVPQAIGSTILVNLLGPILINRWFSNNQGLLIGVQAAFIGLFGIIIQPMTANLLANQGWRMTYIIIGTVAFIVVSMLCVLTLRDNPEELNMSKYTVKIMSKTKETTVEYANINEKEVVRSPSFYLLMLFMIGLTGVGVFTQHISNYGNSIGYSLSQMGTVLAFASVGTAVGSILFGILSDKIGCLKTGYIVVATGLCAVACFVLAGVNIFVFYLAAFFHGLLNSSIIVLGPVLAMQFYGKKDYESIYAKLSIGSPIAAVLLVPAYGFVFDITGGYLGVLIALGVLLVASGLSMFFSWNNRNKLLNKHK